MALLVNPAPRPMLVHNRTAHSLKKKELHPQPEVLKKSDIVPTGCKTSNVRKLW